jgi:uncharacterized protein
VTKDHQGRPRPLSPAAATMSKLLARAWSLPPQRNYVAVDRGVPVPMSDGTVLLADHYLPITGRPAATILVRCPYGRGAPYGLITAQILAERGYHVLLQSCRGTSGSGGEFVPMGNEAADGQDTVAWLREQSWFDGRLATYGASYLGFVQWALALDPPPELVAAVVQVGPHDFSRTAYRNGVFDLYNFLSWSDLMANQDRAGSLLGGYRMVTAERRLRPVLDQMPIATSARGLLRAGAPWFESWLEHPQLSDPFWAPLQCGAALDRLSVPTLLVGGWQDVFIEQTVEQYRALSGRGVPVRLLIGPWAHLDATMRGGAAVVESLAWLDHYTDTKNTGTNEARTYGPVRVWVGAAKDAGGGRWRELPDWPPEETAPQRWYLGPLGTLAPQPPAEDTQTGFRYDPSDPTPSVGGATLSLTAGVRDNRPLEQRSDVLVFSTKPLDNPVEVIGEVTAEIAMTRDNPHADLFARLCDVDTQGRSRNVCDGIVRLADADPLAGTTTVSLLAAAHRFGRGHRIRLLLAGGAHPRFARNPGNGQVDAPPAEFKPTHYTVSLGAGPASALLLPVEEATHA